PPLTGGLIATLNIDLTNTTGTKTKTLSASNPNCRAVGFTTLRCLCDVCNTGSQQTCSANADCPASGRCVGGTNGGKPCTSATQCAGGGTCNGRPCTLGTQCVSGTCTGGFCTTTAGICGGLFGQQCVGGANGGAPCSSGTQCPGGACQVAGTTPTAP